MRLLAVLLGFCLGGALISGIIGYIRDIPRPEMLTYLEIGGAIGAVVFVVLLIIALFNWRSV